MSALLGADRRSPALESTSLAVSSSSSLNSRLSAGLSSLAVGSGLSRSLSLVCILRFRPVRPPSLPTSATAPLLAVRVPRPLRPNATSILRTSGSVTPAATSETSLTPASGPEPSRGSVLYPARTSAAVQPSASCVLSPTSDVSSFRKAGTESCAREERFVSLGWMFRCPLGQA